MKAMAQSGCQERCADTQANKDFQDRLAKMQSERARQDKMWDTSSSNQTQTPETVQQINLGVKSYSQNAYSVYSNSGHQ
jgi:hypothetical protein